MARNFKQQLAREINRGIWSAKGGLANISNAGLLTPDEITTVVGIVQKAIVRKKKIATEEHGIKFTPDVPYHTIKHGRAACISCGVQFGQEHANNCEVPKLEEYKQFVASLPIESKPIIHRCK